MKSKIKQITLTDGKQIFYPSEEEVAKLLDNIKEVIVEETLTRAEFELRMASEAVFADALIDGVGVTRVDYSDLYIWPEDAKIPNGYWWCKNCKTIHRQDHVCVKI